MAKSGKRGPYKRLLDAEKVGMGGIRLRQHRLANGWTVEELAERAGVSVGTITNIEQAEGYTGDMLEKLAKALETTVGALFTLDPREGKDGEFLGLWGRADDHAKQRIMDYGKGVVGDE